MAEHVELHTYLGADPDPVFAGVHVPAGGRARGAVVLLPSLAKEQFDAVRGLRRLAGLLADDGLVVVRVDHAATGDSGLETTRDDVVDRWRDGVALAVEYARELGVGPPAVVALRAGALLASAALTGDEPIGPLVLLDPVGRGRAFLREQRALFAVTVGAADGTENAGVAGEDSTIPLIGTDLTPAAAAELSRLTLDPRLAQAAPRTLVAVRDSGSDKATEGFIESTGAERITVHGMEGFVQAPGYLVRIPDAAIESVARWLSAAMTGEPRDIDPGVRTEARMTDADGREVIERIESLGPHGLFAVRTLPVDGAAHRTVLLFSTANDSHHGPNRAWVTLARRAAARGASVLRFDRRGVGETGPVPAGDLTSLYTPESLEDALTAGRAAGPPATMLATGVCSGSWFSAQLGLRLGIDSVVLVNAILWSWRHKRAARANAAAPDTFGLLRTDPAFQRSLRGRAKTLLQTRSPYPLWRLLGRAGITQVPEVLLRPLVDRGVRVTTVLSPHDEDWFRTQRGDEGLARIQGAGNPTIITTGVGDHPAYHPAVRAAVDDAVLAWCAEGARTREVTG